MLARALRQAPLVQRQAMQYHPRWVPKYRAVYSPQWFDTNYRRWDSHIKNHKYINNVQDPLHFNHNMEQSNGGIPLLIELLHDSRNYNIPLRNRAHLIYNMAKKGIYDPTIYLGFEETYKTAANQHLVARMCFGALWAYYKTNQGTRFGIDFWESKLEDNIEQLHAQEVVELMQAFRDNRSLPRSHMISLLDTKFKKTLLDTWKAEVIFNQRVLFGLAEELYNLKYFDKELWELIATTAIQKKKINNTHYFAAIHGTMAKMNEDPNSGFEGKFTAQIEELVKKHYTQDRQWRYSLENKDWRSLQDLIDRRDDCQIGDTYITKADTDTEIVEQARLAEKKMKRLKMAKYSADLFDEIIEEMMREKKTLMEMLAELDCDEEEIYASQTRIAKKQQSKNIEKNKKFVPQYK